MAETKKFLDFSGLTRYHNNFKGYVDGKLGDPSDLTTTSKSNVVAAINEVDALAKGATKALAVNNYSALITTLMAASRGDYKVGQNFYVKTVDVPDVWISAVNDSSSSYTYVSDSKVIEDINSGNLTIGYYGVSKLEGQKVDLSNYVTSSDLGELADAIDTEIENLEDKKLDKTVEVVIAKSSEELKKTISETIEVSSQAIVDLNNKIDNILDKTIPQTVTEIETKIQDVSDTVASIKVAYQDSLTWSELRTLRDSGKLEPGKYYRITDYTTAVDLPYKSAGHDFDIIVLATSESNLSEEAKAVLKGGNGGSSHGVELENGHRRLYKFYIEDNWEDVDEMYKTPDEEDWYDYVGEHTYNGKTCYLWQKYENGDVLEDQGKSYMLTSTKDMQDASIENFYIPIGYMSGPDEDVGYDTKTEADVIVKCEEVDGTLRVWKTLAAVDIAEYYEYSGDTYTYNGQEYYLWTKVDYTEGELNDYTVISKGAIITETLDIDCSFENPFYPVAFIILDSDSEGYSNYSERFVLCMGGSGGAVDTYFSDSKVDSWKIWYSLDNDKSRFSWAASPKSIPETVVKYLSTSENGDYYRYSDGDQNGLYCWAYSDDSGENFDSDDVIYTKSKSQP